MPTVPTLATSLGAILIGTLLGMLFTGILIVQCVIYWKSAREGDTWRTMLMDLLHSLFIWMASWDWFITGKEQDPDLIPLMYSWRIFKLTYRNYWVTFPITMLAVLRVVGAIGTLDDIIDSSSLNSNDLLVAGAYMYHLKTLSACRAKIGWLFSGGLALSCIVDILITSAMMIILKQSRARSLSMDSVIDSLIVYTLATSAVTALTTVASLICWLSMKNLVFLGLHLVISKLYANSVLAMLNYRPLLRASKSTSGSGGVIDFEVIRLRNNFPGRSGLPMTKPTSLPMVEVNVNKTMQMHTDDSVEK
ncbi:hypothetical protein GYMLUDRAFT_98266 [Collybiopsis luxurians FD-317 M1]|uniref:DUF6534 domain-containing protein n=1 Tax=Collybiopsis luxurians FD-317 M1 TaxID=944289 RepID=A0A0D0BRZ8_9AGAR|nr:hypothetical protein GYMLUDRAFT_98266 [Collybiopsis luxurians FD-317 M1]